MTNAEDGPIRIVPPASEPGALTVNDIDIMQRIGRDEENRRTVVGLVEFDALCNWARHLTLRHAAASRARIDEPEAVRIARAVLECAKSWHYDARILGNVRAIDVTDMCAALIDQHEAAERARESMPAMVRDAAARLAGETTAGHREMTDRALVECHAQLAASREHAALIAKERDEYVDAYLADATRRLAASREECDRVREELGVERVLVKLADQRAAGSDRDVATLTAERDKLQAEVARLTARRFPIMGGPSVLWSFVAPHEAQAKANHDQSLQRLAERGGLSPGELWAVVHGKRWREAPPEAEALAWIRSVVADEQSVYAEQWLEKRFIPKEPNQ